jgi:hypothetical protein
VNRNEKLKILQDALQGKESQLQQVHQQRRKDAMPCKNATGYITVDCCPAEWSGLTVLDMDAAIDDDTRPRQCTFAKWLLLPKSGSSDVCGLFIDARNDKFDAIPLAGMLLELRPYIRRHIYGHTIGDLRRCYNKSAESVERSTIILFVSYVPPCLPVKTAPAK